MSLSRTEALAAAVLLLLGGAGLARIALPKRPALRPLSIEGLHIKSEAIAEGQTTVQEESWRPAADVFLTGWSYRIGAAEANPELLLLHKDTVLFFAQHGSGSGPNPAFYPEDAGYRVPAGEPVTLRLTMTNRGAAGHTQGAQALIYFVPVAGN